MTDKHNEHLSALIDGEELDESLLDDMLQDDAQTSTLQRYQLASSIIRQDSQPGMPLDISAAVAAQVAKEPAHQAVAAKRAWWKPAANDAWWRPAASFAVAASVALVTVIGVHNYQVTPTGEAPASNSRANNPVFETAPMGGVASPVSFNAIQEAPTIPQDGASDQRRQVQSFFVDHQQQTQLSQQEKEAEPETENGQQ